MCPTCEYAPNMSKMIQIRNVPDDLHRLFKSRAALAGMTLSDYLLAEMQRAAEKPTRQELLRRLESRTPVHLSRPVAEVIREERDSR